MGSSGWGGVEWDWMCARVRGGGVGRAGWVGWGEVRQGGGVEWCGGRLLSQVRLGIEIIHCLGLIWELNRPKLFNFFKLSKLFKIFKLAKLSHVLLIFF